MKILSRSFLVVALCFLPFAAFAQPHRPEARVILFEDPDFRGERLELEPGTAIEDLRDLSFPSGRKINDKVSSVRLEGGARVVLFADPIFSGDRLELTESARDLRRLPRSPGRTWDDCITSLRVSGGEPEHHDRDRRWHPAPEHRPQGGVTFYADPDFRGESVWLEPGTSIDDLRDVTFESGRRVNDKVSSIRIEGGVRVTLFADPRFSGDRIDLTESVRDLRQLVRSPERHQSWDDCVTAVRVSRNAMNRPDDRREH